MIFTTTKFYFLAVVIYALLQSSFGLQYQQKIALRPFRGKAFRCTEGGDVIPLSKNSESKRSKMNQMMLDKAQKLRDEAFALEEANKIAEAVAASVTAPESVKNDNSGKSNNKASGEEFVGRFPVERLTLNTPIFTLDAFKANGTTDEVVNGTYVSVLVERESDKLLQKLRLDKISGEAVRSRRENPSSLSDSPVVQTMEGSKIDLAEQETQQDQIKSQLSFNSPFMTKKYKALLSYEFPCTIDSTLKKIVKSNGDEGFELQTLDGYFNTAVDVWYVRLFIKFLVSLILLTSDEKAPRYEEDRKYLELSIGSLLNELLSFQKIGEANEDDLKDIFLELEAANSKFIYYRADYLKAKVTGSVPSITELQKLLATTVVPDGFDKKNDDIYQWRLATISRLQSGTPLAEEQRKFLWNIQPALSTVYHSPDVAVIPVGGDSILSEKVSLSAPASDESDRVQDQMTVSKGVNSQDLLDVKQFAELETLLDAVDTDPIALRQCVDRLYRRVADGPPMSPEVKKVFCTIVDRYNAISGTTEDKASIGLSKKDPDDLSDLSYEELRKFLDLKEDAKLTEVIEKYVKAAVVNLDTTAERFISEYFDEASRTKGMVLSREGAGRFQVEMLKDLFVVSSVKMSQGAVIFDGSFKAKNSAEFSEKLDKKFSACKMSEEVEYTILMNERYPDLDKGLQQAALDQMLGRSPCVVLYPKQWNSTVNSNLADPSKKIFRTALSTLASISSAAFAASCLDMFNPTSTYMVTGIIPDDFLPLAFMPLTIQYTSDLVEKVVGRLKGFNVSSIVVPSFSLFTFGSRSIYTSLPKNRNDIFDTAAIGISVALLYSLTALFLGLQITATATSEAVASFPSVSLALLKTNAVVSQLLSYELPMIAQEVAAAGPAVVSATDATVHLHWLAIAGAVSFIANTLQLIPADNSAGSKLGQSVIGSDNFQIVSLFTGAIKFLIVFPMLFTMNTVGAITSPRLLFDYFVTSQVAGNEEVCSLFNDPSI